MSLRKKPAFPSYLFFVFAGDEVDRFLVFLHAADVVFQRGHFIAAGTGVEMKELGELLAIHRIFVDTELKMSKIAH